VFIYWCFTTEHSCPNWSRTQGDEIASLRRWERAIGCRYDDASTQASHPCLHSLAPTHISEDCRLVTWGNFCCHLRSAEVDTCFVRWTRTRLGDCNFTGTVYRRLYAALILNSLNLNDCWKLTCLVLLKWQHISDCVFSSPRILLTYLLTYLLSVKCLFRFSKFHIIFFSCVFQLQQAAA